MNDASAMSAKHRRPERFIFPLLVFVGVLALWELVVRAAQVPQYLVPPPSTLLSHFHTMRVHLATDTLVTLAEAVGGFALGNCIGILLAVAFVHSRALELSIYPYAIALKTIPIVAIAPLLVLWFGNGLMPKVVVSALICFFPAIVNTVRGLKSIDQEALDLFKSLSASKWQVLMKLRFPNAVPYIFSALKIAATLCVIGAIVGEFSGADKGLGFLILISSYRLETASLFIGIIISACIGLLLFGIVAWLESRFAFWQKIES